MIGLPAWRRRARRQPDRPIFTETAPRRPSPPCTAGFANQPTSVSADDGLELRGAYVTAPVRCAPPANKPTPEERDTCAPWLHREVELLRPTLRVVVALGAFAWNAWWPTLQAVYG